jgi:hypothetical protein
MILTTQLKDTGWLNELKSNCLPSARMEDDMPTKWNPKANRGSYTYLIKQISRQN